MYVMKDVPLVLPLPLLNVLDVPLLFPFFDLFVSYSYCVPFYFIIIFFVSISKTYQNLLRVYPSVCFVPSIFSSTTNDYFFFFLWWWLYPSKVAYNRILSSSSYTLEQNQTCNYTCVRYVLSLLLDYKFVGWIVYNHKCSFTYRSNLVGCVFR